MKYLIATDGSSNARACVQDMSISTLSHDDQIKVIAVWNADPFALIPAKLDNAKALSLVRETVDALQLSFGDRVSSECLRGDVVTMILRTAQTWQADKILIGAHAYTGMPEALIGDIAKEVLRKSKNSVVVYRHLPEGTIKAVPKKVLWCIDSAALANRVFVLLQNPIDLPLAAELRILHILQSVDAMGRKSSVQHDMSSDRDSIHRNEMQQLMDEQIEKIRRIRPDVAASTAMVEGVNPVAGILKYASDWQADLIVTGAHTYTVGERILLGSASEELVNRATCSVEVVR
jgi:nucleotide-binding universal stress UspA family protein